MVTTRDTATTFFLFFATTKTTITTTRKITTITTRKKTQHHYTQQKKIDYYYYYCGSVKHKSIGRTAVTIRKEVEITAFQRIYVPVLECLYWCFIVVSVTVGTIHQYTAVNSIANRFTDKINFGTDDNIYE